MDRKCLHESFEAQADVFRVTEGADEGAPVKGYDVTFRVRCSQCHLPFVFIGLPFGYSPFRPMLSPDGQELRAPLAPMARSHTDD